MRRVRHRTFVHPAPGPATIGGGRRRVLGVGRGSPPAGSGWRAGGQTTNPWVAS